MVCHIKHIEKTYTLERFVVGVKVQVNIKQIVWDNSMH